MEEVTISSQAIVLKRQDYQEVDNLITLYSLDFGKLKLVARGAKKIESRMSCFIEPLSYLKIMIIQGKKINYLGGVASENIFLNIKEDFDKLEISLKALNIFDKLVAYESQDYILFALLKDFLEILDDEKNIFFISKQLFLSFFILKLLSLLGYKPDLHNCNKCKNIIKENDENIFDFTQGSLVCENCKKNYIEKNLKITSLEIKILRFCIENDFSKIIKLRVINEEKIIYLISKFLKWND